MFRLSADVFVSSGGTVSLVSHAHNDATEASGARSWNPTIGADGMRIAFGSKARDLVMGFDSGAVRRQKGAVKALIVGRATRVDAMQKAGVKTPGAGL